MLEAKEQNPSFNEQNTYIEDRPRVSPPKPPRMSSIGRFQEQVREAHKATSQPRHDKAEIELPGICLSRSEFIGLDLQWTSARSPIHPNDARLIVCHRPQITRITRMNNPMYRSTCHQRGIGGTLGLSSVCISLKMVLLRHLAFYGEKGFDLFSPTSICPLVSIYGQVLSRNWKESTPIVFCRYCGFSSYSSFNHTVDYLLPNIPPS